MKALVLAGGSGTRLRPLSYSMPKQLIPVGGRPVLEHGLRAIRDAGITEVAVVVGDRGPEIEAVIGDGAQLGLTITYLHQDRPRGLAHAVVLAGDFLADDDFVMYLGDNVVTGGIAGHADQFRAARVPAHLLVTAVEDPREYGVAELAEDSRIIALQEKPAEPRSNLAVMGVYFFTPAIHEAIAQIVPSARGELEITDAIQWLVEHGRRVTAAEFTGYWKDTGRVDDVLDCNRILLDDLAPAVDGYVDEVSRLDGSVVVEGGAQVLRSHVVGPVVIGAGTVVSDSYLGPHTSLGRDCRLQGAGVEHSIVLDGVSVNHVRGIYGSLIGRAADVSAADGHGDRHRLVIGDHTRVEVS